MYRRNDAKSLRLRLRLAPSALACPSAIVGALPVVPPFIVRGQSVPLPPIGAARRVPRICARRVRVVLACVPPPRVRSSGRCPASFAKRGASLGCPRACAQLPAIGRPAIACRAYCPAWRCRFASASPVVVRARVALPRSARQRAARFPPALRSLAIGGASNALFGLPAALPPTGRHSPADRLRRSPLRGCFAGFPRSGASMRGTDHTKPRIIASKMLK